MKALIIDDEVQSHVVLKNALTENHPEVEVLDAAFGVKEGIQLIKKYDPDLIFLDIEMPDGTGFDLLNLMPKINFQIIFVTGLNQHAQTAIRLGALDYLIKPVVPEELSAALEKAKQKQEQQSLFTQLEIMRETLERLQRDQPPKRISIPTARGVLFFDSQDIIQLDAMQNFTEFILETSDKRLIASCNIKKYEEDLLPFPTFMRIHRSHIINLYKVARLQKGDRWYVEMINGTILSVSRKNRDKLEEELNKI